MSSDRHLPVFASVRQAYGLLWRHRVLHARAIWPPVLFLVCAEFLYHRVIGNAHGLSEMWNAAIAAHWYVLLGAALAWLAGLKFLLSFSVSWRRHLMLGERFDPFFFHAPFWKYLGFLVLTYVWAMPLLAISFLPAVLLASRHASATAGKLALIPVLVAVLLILWAIVRQVPYFNVLTLDPPQPGWRRSITAMRGNAVRYAAIWVMAMLPIIGLNALLDFGLEVSGADRHLVAVALGESVFRQAMLFVHFSLGASIGLLTYTATLAAGQPEHADIDAGEQRRTPQRTGAPLSPA